MFPRKVSGGKKSIFHKSEDLDRNSEKGRKLNIFSEKLAEGRNPENGRKIPAFQDLGKIQKKGRKNPDSQI